MKFPVEQILNLPNMKVLDFQELEGEEIIITIEKSVNYSTCPWCGQITHSIYQNHWRIIHDLPWNKKTVLLKINRRQFKCHKCKKVVIDHGAIANYKKVKPINIKELEVKRSRQQTDSIWEIKQYKFVGFKQYF